MEELGAKVERVKAALGPHIGECCYKVGPEVAEALGRAGREQVDLGEINREQLRAAGVGEDNIEAAGICTCCDRGFFSYRRDGGVTGRQAGFLAW
jgi:hypothetical protein